MRYGRNFCRRTASLQAPRDDRDGETTLWEWSSILFTRKNVGLAGVLQPDMFDVCRLTRYAAQQTLACSARRARASIPSSVRKGERYPKAVSQMHPREERGYRKSH